MPGISDYLKVGGGLVHPLANIVGNVRVGEGARIDAFVTITGDVEIGCYTHVGTMTCIFGTGGVSIGDYVGISPGVKIFTGTEDPSGEWVTNPTVPDHMRNPKVSPIRIADHCLIGANTVLLPGADMPQGAAVGCLSLVKHSLGAWALHAGVPARLIRARSRGVLDVVGIAY